MKGIQEEIILKLATDLGNEKEKLIKDRFLEVTGEQLTKENADRVVINLPYYTSIFDKREIYTIDGIAILEIYAPQVTTYEEGDTWKMAYKINYRKLND